MRGLGRPESGPKPMRLRSILMAKIGCPILLLCAPLVFGTCVQPIREIHVYVIIIVFHPFFQHSFTPKKIYPKYTFSDKIG